MFVLRCFTLKLAECTLITEYTRRASYNTYTCRMYYRHRNHHKTGDFSSSWLVLKNEVIRLIITSMSGVHSLSLCPVQRRTHFAHYISLKKSIFRNVPLAISGFVMNSKFDTFSSSISPVPDRTNF